MKLHSRIVAFLTLMFFASIAGQAFQMNQKAYVPFDASTTVAVECLDSAPKVAAGVTGLAAEGDEGYAANVGASSAKKPSSTATAWFVTPTNAVTCAHCVKEEVCPHCGAAKQKEFWFEDASGRCVNLRMAGLDGKADIALLEVADSDWRSPVCLSVATNIPRHAEKVWTLGYPIPYMLGTTIKYGEGVVRAHEGLHGNEKQFSVTAPIRPGLSGGPVFDCGGKVCGVMNATLKAKLVMQKTGHVSPESNFAVKVGYLRALLEKHGIRCDEAEASALPENRADAVETASQAVVLFHADVK